MKTLTHHHKLSIVTLCVLGFPLMGADECGGLGGGGFEWGDANRPPAYDDARIMAAESELASHDVRAAQRAYTDVLADGASAATSTASAGQGLTQLMLLPGAPSARVVLTEHLGADNTGFDAQALIWAEEGVLYWLSRGTRWEDDGEFQGVRSLVEALLPWTPERLESLTTFCAGIDTPLSELFASAESVASSIEGIEANLIAATDAGDFDYLYVPAAVFHDDDLSLSLGAAELHALAGALALTRAAIHYAAAWRLDSSFDEICGPRWQAALDDPEHPDHVPGYDVADYAWRNLDDALGREVAHVDRLTASRDAARLGLTRLSDALRLAAVATNPTTTFDLGATTPDDLLAAADTLDAFASALDGPSALPGSSPSTTLDLSALFTSDAALAAEVSWFTRTEDGDWTLSDAAVQRFLVDPAFSPTFQVSAEDAPQLEVDPAGAFDELVGSTLTGFESLYFSTF